MSLVDLLKQSLDPKMAKSVQGNLVQYESQPGFAIELLKIVNDAQQDQSVRLAAALSFKNLVRRKWVDASGAHQLSPQDVTAIRREVLDLMISLPHANLRAQLGEAVSLIADSDFPEKWDNLVPALVSKIGQDPKVNNGVLTIAHSIFARWRPLFRSDDLFTEIALVLSQFTQPYLALMVQTHEAIQTTTDVATLKDLLETMSLLVKLFYDLNCQDIPEFFEDNIKSFMEIFHYYLTYQNAQIEVLGDEDHAGVLEEIRADICEILQLYAQKYEEEFGSFISTFVQSVLALLIGLRQEPRFDLVANRALGFLVIVAGLKNYLELFEGELQQLILQIIVPNIKLTEQDEELFEDEPIEYIRRDLEGADSDTRRRAATDLLRELATKLESRVTGVVLRLVEQHIGEYSTNPSAHWRAKNTATYLFSCVATKGVVTSKGISSTNLQVDIIQFFNANIAPDLLNSAHPILQVDAIKFIYNFRNQLTKDQLAEAMGVLVKLLTSDQYVVYTCAAITIERILSIREGGILGSGSLMFAKTDIQPVAKSLVTSLMGLILKSQNDPVKLSENEFLVKCIMRVLILVQDVSFGDELLPALVRIVEILAANPANPRFSHYLFESIGATIKYNEFSESQLDQIIVQPLLSFLAQDVTEFIPYVLQILSLILARRQQPGLPPTFQQLVRPLLTPVLWEPRGNVPALAGLIAVILQKGADTVVAEDLLVPLLGVFQRLLTSKSNDVYAIEMLEYILSYMSPEAVRPLSKDIAQCLLMRLQNSRTEKFVARFSKFVYFVAASSSLGPEYAIQLLDQVQPSIFGRVFEKFICPSTLKIHGMFDRRIAAVGLSHLLLKTPQFSSGEYQPLFVGGMSVLVKLLSNNVSEKLADLVVDVDLEELSFGNTFSPLSVVGRKPLDPVPHVQSPIDYVKGELSGYTRAPDAMPTLDMVAQTLDPDQQEFFKQLVV